jgi:hypothetical protein
MKSLALGFLLLAACQKSSRPPLKIEAYVWQSPARPEVQRAMTQSIGVVSSFMSGRPN